MSPLDEAIARAPIVEFTEAEKNALEEVEAEGWKPAPPGLLERILARALTEN